MKQKKSIGLIAALVATAIWAGNFVVARALADSIPPIQFNFWRWFIALIAILPFGLKNLGQDMALARKSFAYLSLMAILGVTLMNTFVYKAGQTTESLNMALIMPATPMVILILARIFYNEPITGVRLAGMILASLGILALVSRGSLDRLLNMQFQPGDIWTLACMLCFALYSLFMRQRPTDISPAGFNIIVFGLGLIYCLPFLGAELWLLPGIRLSWEAVIGIGYAGLGCSALAFWLWTVSIDRIGPVKSGIIYYALPFFAAIMGRIVLDERVTLAQLWGGCLIIGGILLATLPFSRKIEDR